MKLMLVATTAMVTSLLMLTAGAFSFLGGLMLGYRVWGNDEGTTNYSNMHQPRPRSTTKETSS